MLYPYRRQMGSGVMECELASAAPPDNAIMKTAGHAVIRAK